VTTAIDLSIAKRRYSSSYATHQRMPRRSTVRLVIFGNEEALEQHLRDSNSPTGYGKPLWMSVFCSFAAFDYDPSPTSYFVCQLAGIRRVAPWLCSIRRCVEQIPRCTGKRTAHVVRCRERFDCVACALSRRCQAASGNVSNARR
jgi:hypothetical protein